MDQGGSGKPGHQRPVFDRIPGPIATPTEFFIGPISADDDAGAQHAPREQGPGPGFGDPVGLLATGNQYDRGHREGNGRGGVSEEHDRRVNQHGRVLQERTQPVALAGGGQTLLHRIGAEDQRAHQEAEVGHQYPEGGFSNSIGRSARPEAIGHGQCAEHPCPKQQRSGLSDPKRRERIVPRQEPVRVLLHVSELEILGQQCPGQDARCDAQQEDRARTRHRTGASQCRMLGPISDQAGKGCIAGTDQRGE